MITTKDTPWDLVLLVMRGSHGASNCAGGHEGHDSRLDCKETGRVDPTAKEAPAPVNVEVPEYAILRCDQRTYLKPASGWMIVKARRRQALLTGWYSHTRVDEIQIYCHSHWFPFCSL